MSPYNLADLVGLLVTAEKPIIFYDTCTLLDLIRLPIREESPDNIISILEAAKSIRDAVNNDNIYSIRLPLVSQEWSKHAEKIQSDTKFYFENLDMRIEATKRIAAFNGQSFESGNLQDLELHNSLYDLSLGLLHEGLALSEDDDVMKRASVRTLACHAPAAKGKELQDCVIYEHALQVMAELRTQGIGSPLVFLTSNIKDFCEQGSVPKEPIKTELENLGAVLVTQWTWAEHELHI